MKYLSKEKLKKIKQPERKKISNEIYSAHQNYVHEFEDDPTKERMK